MTHGGQTGITFQSHSYQLLGTLFMARGDAPKPTAILLHGIPGIEKNYDLAHTLRYHGWNALIFHYRGCWGSHGNYNFRTIPDDVRAAIDELTSGKYPVVDENKLVLIGHSLGGWAAILAGAVDSRPRGVAALCAVTDPGQFRLNDPNYAQFYTPWLTGITPESLANQWMDLNEQFSPLFQAKKISPRPLLIVHSETDEEVSVEHSYALFDEAIDPKEIYIHPDANHAFSWHRPWLREQVLNWLDRLHLNQ